jgi:excinuclease UvrABC ATPase subunit
MMAKAIFEGLIVDEFDQPVSVTYVGEDPCYVVNDQGFLRHILSVEVDRQVLDQMAEMIQGNEEFLAEMTARQLGQEDIFSKAIIEKQLKNVDSYLENLLQVGIPEEARAYLGMLGFQIRINVHGEVLEVHQPGVISPEDE